MQVWPSKLGCPCSSVLRKMFENIGGKRYVRQFLPEPVQCLHSEFKPVGTSPCGLAPTLLTERNHVLHGRNSNGIPWSSCGVLRLPEAETPMKWQFTQVSKKWFILKVVIHGNSEKDEQSGSGRTGVGGWLWIQGSSKTSATDFVKFYL